MDFDNYIDGMKPYPNEHAARINDPRKYKKFRRENDKFGAGIHAIWGIAAGGKAELQAIRFDSSKFSVEQAHAWLKKHDYKPILFEPAKEKSADISVKIAAIDGCKVAKREGKLYLSGYANTKNVADRYGDVPTVYKAKRDFVYDLTDFKKNPVMLIDHCNQTDHVAGSFTILEEDERGLKFEACFSDSEHPIVAHARTVYAEGHAKALSIAGRFYFEDDENPKNLTLAKIFEISLVPVPADPNALATAMEKALNMVEEKTKSADRNADDEICNALRQLRAGEELTLAQLRLLNKELPGIGARVAALVMRDPELLSQILDGKLI